MSNCAYKDINRTIRVNIAQTDKESRNKRFYCPNHNCDAYMYICGLNGVNSTYFRATKSNHRHIKNCHFSKNNDFNLIKYDESKFHFHSTLEKLLSDPNTKPKNNSKNKVDSVSSANCDSNDKNRLKQELRTTRKIYDMCKSLSYTDNYNGEVIGQMLVDSRSSKMYPKGIFGYRLVEGIAVRGNYYDTKKLEILLRSTVLNKNYKFKLLFSDEDLFKIIKNNIYHNRDKTFIIAGDWKASDKFNIFSTNFNNKKQFHLI